LPLASAIPSAKIGRASKGAAQTLLGKVYLTIGDKTSAATVLKEVYNSNQYALLPSYASLWGPNVKIPKNQFLRFNIRAVRCQVHTVDIIKHFIQIIIS